MEDLNYGKLYDQMDLSDYTVPGMLDLQYEIKGQADRIINVCTNFQNLQGRQTSGCPGCMCTQAFSAHPENIHIPIGQFHTWDNYASIGIRLS